MDPPDDDIQFDFFEEEPPTSESSSADRRPLPQPRRAPLQRSARLARASGPSSPRPPVRPLATLGAVVFLVVFILLFFAILIASCAGESRHTAYSNYAAKVNTIAEQSTTDGKSTVSALTTQGYSARRIVQQLTSIGATEDQNLRAAESLVAPGRLRTEHAHLIEALELRVSGVDGLAAAFQGVTTTKACQSANPATFASWTYQLLASDVVWANLFQKPAQTQVDADGVSQVTIPSSTFLAEPDSFASAQAMSLVLGRVCGTAGPNTTPAGLHGTNIESVVALTGGTSGSEQTLNEGRLNVIATSPNLAILVTIHDGGISQEVGIKVTLTMPQDSGGPITLNKIVQLVDPGDNASVKFTNLGEEPFGETKSTLSVDVAKVPGEVDLSNNHASYQVIFTLPK